MLKGYSVLAQMTRISMDMAGVSTDYLVLRCGRVLQSRGMTIGNLIESFAR